MTESRTMMQQHAHLKRGLASPNMIDLTGQRFGRLYVRGLDHQDRLGHWHWECQCDCGNVTHIRGSHLTNGHTQCCYGCEVEAEANIQEYVKFIRKHTSPHRVRIQALLREHPEGLKAEAIGQLLDIANPREVCRRLCNAGYLTNVRKKQRGMPGLYVVDQPQAVSV